MVLLACAVAAYFAYANMPESGFKDTFLAGAIILLLIGAIASLVALRIRERKRSIIRRGMCRKCGYDLRGNTTGTCPECGMTR